MTLKSLQQYGKGFQLKVLGSLLTDKKFLLNVRDVLYPEYWDADSHKWIITQITDYGFSSGTVNFNHNAVSSVSFDFVDEFIF